MIAMTATIISMITIGFIGVSETPVLGEAAKTAAAGQSAITRQLKRATTLFLIFFPSCSFYNRQLLYYNTKLREIQPFSRNLEDKLVGGAELWYYF